VRDRFDIGLLDPEFPFEIDDDNRPHLYKHVAGSDGRWIGLGLPDIVDLYLADDTEFQEGVEEGAADWLMVGEVPGVFLIVPLAPPRSKDTTQCRPIGIYSPSRDPREMHQKGTK
jgi:hypothetical protein